jgi:Fic-DOC domain mobile mystery protein B
MSDLFYQEDDATPLIADEFKGLIPTHVTLRYELNELEQKNILEADQWAFQRKRNILDEGFLCRLHKRMFNKVWKWAGHYRTTERNLGVEPWKIQPELHQILDDVLYQIEHETYASDEIAVRFHHRLVAVHPFPNGNGRWSRLAADMLIVRLGGSRFTWGRTNLQNTGNLRKAYIDALHAADNHDPRLLIVFARS